MKKGSAPIKSAITKEVNKLKFMNDFKCYSGELYCI